MNQNKKPFMVIDVDLTIVDSVCSENGWLAWLNAKTGKNFTAEELGWNYNLGKLFAPFWPEYNTVNPMDWWRYAGIYDTMTPYEGSREAIAELSKKYDIIFASHCKGAHMKSKYMFLKRFFGEHMKAFVATKEKWTINSGVFGDVIVDDRNEHLQDESKYRIKFITNWSQFSQLNKPVNFEAANWKQIQEELL